jgi:hypothetical protein
MIETTCFIMRNGYEQTNCYFKNNAVVFVLRLAFQRVS